MLNYLTIINQYIEPGTLTSKIYLIHAVLVTNKALAIGRKLELGREQLEFIEEAAMLHDLGVVKVQAPKMACQGELPYICHGVAGGELLRAMDLERHARVAERHVGVGLTAVEIKARSLPLPEKDFVPVSLAEKIITYADLFFSKSENREEGKSLWREESAQMVMAELAGFGEEQVEIFQQWRREFEGVRKG
jgi:uncharacterized protein